MEPVAVCVCTYRRPTQLARLLKTVAEMPRPFGTMFVIVDNDSSRTETETLVNAFQGACGAPVTFIVESEPGLSAVRNTALKVARNAGARSVAFLDDDEWPSSQWLMKLLDAARYSGAAVVGGPVRPVFEPGSEPARKYETLWSVQRGQLGGRTYVYCSCNCLIDLTAISILGDQPFPDEFRYTGGEDVVVFRRLHAAGTQMAWSDEAIVFEDISAERASLKWLRRRWYRLGNIGVKCEQAAPAAERFTPFTKTILLALRLPVYPLLNPKVLTMPLLWLLEAERIRGRLACHAGFVAMQYGREG